MDKDETSSLAVVPPSTIEVRAALARLLKAEPLRSSPQLASFLSFIVNETLEGRGQDLKGYSIATLALGRPESFDPQLDPIVRVQAGRLRQALAEYNAAHPGEVIVIQLDKGVYVPRFEKRADVLVPDHAAPVSGLPAGVPTQLLTAKGERLAGQADGRATPPANAEQTAPSGPFWRNLAIASVVGLLAMGSAFLMHLQRDRNASGSPRTAIGERLIPSMIVEAGAGFGNSLELQSLVQRTRDATSRFDDIIVVHDMTDMVSALTATATPRPGSALTLRLNATPATEGTQRISARLIDQSDQALLWSREFDPVANGPGGDSARTRIIQSIATTIAQPYGVIHAHLRNKISAGMRQDDPYGCIVAGFDYWRSNDSRSHKAVRDCLTERIATNRTIAGLHVQLAYLHLEEFRQGYNPLPGNALDRALDSARRAVEIAPASARSHQALLAVHFARREMDSAWRAAEAAVALNPYDTEIQADLGARHVQSGNYEKGLMMLQDALQLNPAPPTWAVTFRALALYMLGRVEQSGPLASALKGSEYAPAMMALIMVGRQYSDPNLAKQALADMRRLHPMIVENPGAYLQRLNFDEQTVARVVRDFTVSRDWAASLP